MAGAAPAAHAEPCRIERTPDIPVIMSGLRPTITAQINGHDARLVVDSGAFFSMLTPAAAQQFQLPVVGLPVPLWVEGIGGREDARVVRARRFAALGASWNDAEFVVAGSDFGADTVGLLGQNILHVADVEYDLANGAIRLARPRGSCNRTALAYWAEAAGKPWSAIDIQPATAPKPYTLATAYLNGVKIRVMFDTGAARSALTLRAARQAGITPASPEVRDGGFSYGIGHHVHQTWIAPFSTFKIGDEEIQHAKLRFGDLELTVADMLIGADFFLSHRIYVASSQGRLYFTYNGGPVFDLSVARDASPSADSQPGAASDAAGFARRGAASDARQDYGAALADLDRACELAPTESSYFYQRGLVHWHKGQQDLALADLDRAIELKNDNIEALVARAQVRIERGARKAAVSADLDAAARALPKEADLHLQIGHLYESAELPEPAVLEYSRWIDSHPRANNFMPGALNGRCWSRALAGAELAQALEDCNAALRLKPNTAEFFDSRGLVHLRHNDYDRAIADYDAALRLRPNTAWSLYGRGLARLHKGLAAEGQADIDAALALSPQIASRAAGFGISP